MRIFHLLSSIASSLFVSSCLRGESLVTAANEGPIIDIDIQIANGNDGDGVFELKQPDSLFIPFGEYPHAKGLQKFDRQSGEFLQQTFNSLPAKLGRLFTPGVPIYRGHPDVPGRPDSDPSAPAVGWINSVQVENDGVTLGVKWSPEGTTAIANAHYRFYSPNWLLRSVKGGIQPVKLLSVGLTNNPRIPVPAIANDDNPEQSAISNQQSPMQLSAILRRLFGLAENDADPTTPEALDTLATGIESRIATLTSAANDAQTTLATRTGELEAIRGQLTTAQSESATAREQLTAANDRATSARTRLVDSHLGTLVESTRVLPADRDALRAELIAIENDDALDARFGELAATEPKLKTKAITTGLGKQKSDLKQAANDEAERSAQRSKAIQAELVAIVNDTTKASMSASARYDLAFNRAAKANPALFPAKPQA